MHADNGSIQDLGMAEEQGLKLGRGDLVSLVLDELLVSLCVSNLVLSITTSDEPDDLATRTSTV